MGLKVKLVHKAPDSSGSLMNPFSVAGGSAHDSREICEAQQVHFSEVRFLPQPGLVFVLWILPAEVSATAPHSLGPLCCNQRGILSFPGCPCHALRHPSAWIQEQHCEHHETLVCQGTKRLQPPGV